MEKNLQRGTQESGKSDVCLCSLQTFLKHMMEQPDQLPADQDDDQADDDIEGEGPDYREHALKKVF